MSTDNNAGLAPGTREEFVAHSIPTPADYERRRIEARTLLVEFLVRRILAQIQGTEDIRKAA